MIRKLAAVVAAVLMALPAAALEQVETKNFAKDKFVFPDDIQGEGVHLVFLGIAKDQDNGTWQGEELIRWHRALLDTDAIPEATLAWHFAVMESPPFFVKGLIRNAIGETYEGLIPPEQGAVLYIKDLQAFAAAADVPLDGQPTIVAYESGRGVTGTWRGEVSEAGLAAIGAHLAGAPVAADAL